MTIEIYAHDDYRTPKVAVHNTEALNDQARFAFSLIERWGLVAAASDGEDSAGRAKRRALTAEELAVKAFDASKAAYAEARKRDLIITLPTLDEIREMDRVQNGRNRA